MLMMRVTPKISDRPAPTKNRLDAAARPLSAWNRRASRVMQSWSCWVGTHAADRVDGPAAVVPAKAGTHSHGLWNMGPRLRGDDNLYVARVFTSPWLKTDR